MERVDAEDNETCAPEVVCDGSQTIDDNDISYYDPSPAASEIVKLERDPNRIYTYNRSEPQDPKNYTPSTNGSNKYNKLLNPSRSPKMNNQKTNIFHQHTCINPEKSDISHSSIRNSERKESECKKAPMICTSCRTAGHTARDCPKDPNTRSGANPFEELERISHLRTPKITMKDIRTNRKHHTEKEGFKDIADLIATIKEKQNGFSPVHVNTLNNLTTEEAEMLRLSKEKE